MVRAFFPLGTQCAQPLVKIPMRLEDHAKILKTALGKELERCNPIEEDATENHHKNLIARQILDQ